MTQKVDFKKMIDLNIKKIVFVIKIIDLNTKVFIKKIIVTLIF